MQTNVRQRDRNDCAAACLASVAAHYRRHLSPVEIRHAAGTREQGTTLFGLLEAARHFGFEGRAVRAEYTDLRHATLPAIAHVMLPDGGGPHFVVVYAVGRRAVRVMDPATGRRRRIQRVEWEAQWTGVLLLLTPGESFVTGRDKPGTLVRFLQLLRPGRRVLLQALGVAVLYSVLGLTSAIFLQQLIDHVWVSEDVGLLTILGCGMAGVTLLMVLLGAAKSVMVLRTGQLLDAKLVLSYFEHLQVVPQGVLDGFRTGELISRVNDAVKIRAFINEVVINLVVNVAILTVSFALMFTYYWKLACAALLILPVYAVIYLVTNYLNRRRERTLMRRAADLETEVVEQLNARTSVRQLGLADWSTARIERSFIGLLDESYRSGLNNVFAQTSGELAARGFTLLVLWLGSYFVLTGTLTAGELLGFYALVAYFNGPARSIVTFNRSVQHALIAADRLFEILDLAPAEAEVATEDVIQVRDEAAGDLVFSGVHFGYVPETEVLRGVSLHVRAGTLVALVGESGCGKSTLTQLVQKLYVPRRGNITLGGVDLTYLDTKSLRRRIGVVPQSVDLFAGTVIENIAPGVEAPDLRRVLALAKRLGVHEFVQELPQGFRTLLGPGGRQLSGGQQQRLALARALYHDPDLLLLDEPTAALDARTERVVLDTLAELRTAGKTILLVTHRTASLSLADAVVTLEQGTVVDTEQAVPYRLAQ